MGVAVGVSHGGWEVSVNTVDLNSHGRQLLGTSSLVLKFSLWNLFENC